jgi:hypothetical protein
MIKKHLKEMKKKAKYKRKPRMIHKGNQVKMKNLKNKNTTRIRWNKMS